MVRMLEDIPLRLEEFAEQPASAFASSVAAFYARFGGGLRPDMSVRSTVPECVCFAHSFMHFISPDGVFEVLTDENTTFTRGMIQDVQEMADVLNLPNLARVIDGFKVYADAVLTGIETDTAWDRDAIKRQCQETDRQILGMLATDAEIAAFVEQFPEETQLALRARMNIVPFECGEAGVESLIDHLSARVSALAAAGDYITLPDTAEIVDTVAVMADRGPAIFERDAKMRDEFLVMAREIEEQLNAIPIPIDEILEMMGSDGVGALPQAVFIVMRDHDIFDRYSMPLVRLEAYLRSAALFYPLEGDDWRKEVDRLTEAREAAMTAEAAKESVEAEQETKSDIIPHPRVNSRPPVRAEVRGEAKSKANFFRRIARAVAASWSGD